MKNGNIIPDFDELKEGFSKRLKNLRVEKTPQGKIILQKNKEPKKTPVEQVAEKTEMSEKMYRKWESGDFLKHLPSGEKLVTMANYHNVSVDYLLGLSDFTTPGKDFIGKETGLSDDAINQLKKRTNATHTDNDKLQILSILICNNDFWKLLGNIDLLISNKTQQHIALNTGNDDRVAETIQTDKLERFDASAILDKMLKDISAEQGLIEFKKLFP